MSIKNPQQVKRQLDEAENMLMVLQDSVRRKMKLDPVDVINRFNVIREKVRFAHDNIQG